VYDKTVRRRRAVLLLLVVSSLILLTAYFGESAGGGLHGVQRGVSDVVSPIQEGASRALKPFRDLFGWFGDTLNAKGDLKKAREERDTWQERAVAAQAATAENTQLRQLVGLGKELSLGDYSPVTARVIGQSPTLWYATIKIDKGTSAGLQRDMPVIASDGSDSGRGLIGKIETAGSNNAVVRLITDSKVAVGALTLGSRTKGVVTPKVGDPNDLVLKYTLRGDAVSKGETVVTSGTTSNRDDLESPFPPSLPIGQVTRVDDPGTDAQVVHLKPFVDLRRIDFVQVLSKRVDGNR
jgi:rod shape-determining protein MreC